MLNFLVLKHRERLSFGLSNLIVLVPNDWDDYSFKSTFEIVFYNSNSERMTLGSTKIGYVGQPKGWTLEKMPREFSRLDSSWFSLGQDVDFYYAVTKAFPIEQRNEFLAAIGDVSFDNSRLLLAESETVFQDSLMRGVSRSVIFGQYRRVLSDQPVLTDFHFEYRSFGSEKFAPLKLGFRVEPESKPATNIHVLIGRNGVGKTSLLNSMVEAIVKGGEIQGGQQGAFYEIPNWIGEKPLPKDYFSSVVSVSFSVFDKFTPPMDRPNRSEGVAYFYVGMKRVRLGMPIMSDGRLKSDKELFDDFWDGLKSCRSQLGKKARWLKAIVQLESDRNFADMNLTRLIELSEEREAFELASSLFTRMSSGHSIVLLTITKLVDTVEEKTLVLLDEPESHLHPPLLSAFTRALADLLHDRNGVAIIATHSPVVVQEVPRLCVWKLSRLGGEGRVDRPNIETFGENVGALTREIFGLEVSKSGFLKVLQQAVDTGKSFDAIVEEYGGQLGIEALVILRTLISARGSKSEGPAT